MKIDIETKGETSEDSETTQYEISGWIVLQIFLIPFLSGFLIASVLMYVLNVK